MNRFKLQQERDTDAERSRAFDALMDDITKFLDNEQKDPLIARALAGRARAMVKELLNHDVNADTVKKADVLSYITQHVLESDQKGLMNLAISLEHGYDIENTTELFSKKMRDKIQSINFKKTLLEGIKKNSGEGMDYEK